jgi:uncharacterized HAD superfamily protein
MWTFLENYKGRKEMNLKDVWTEQKDFNELFRHLPEGFEQQSDLTQHMVLCIMSELDEILGTVQWKHHRNIPIKPNPQQTLSECVDVFKYLITIVQAWGFTEKDFIDAFWKKSMVVRQRRSEEFLKNVDGPTAVIDIDGVICDHNLGFLSWLRKAGNLHNWQDAKLVDKEKTLGYIDTLNRHDLGMSPKEWQNLKHEFRISGYKEYMPVFDDAKEFLTQLKDKNIVTVLMTSRPIDRYPNLYTDTVAWLEREHLPYDVIWWSYDKADHVVENLPNPLFAVDNDLTQVNKFDAADIPVYWLCRRKEEMKDFLFNEPFNRIHMVNKLQQIPIGD